MKHIDVLTENNTAPNDRFWAAAGLDELYALAETDAGQFLMHRMREKGTCRYVRNHYTLNREIHDGLRCGGDVYSEDADGNPVYDLSWINGVYRRFVGNGLKLVVELDFMPDALSCGGEVRQEGSGEKQENRFLPKDWNKWNGLLRAFVKNLIAEFGAEEVRTWYFEVWNEPDSWTIESWKDFFRLYDVFAEAVKSVDSSLRVGGPGCFRQTFLYSFLDHAANGVNCVTGKKSIPLDFISYHIYGMSGGWLNEYPLIMPSVQRFTQELMWVKRMIDVFPKLKNTEFLLDEWGVVSNYEKSSSEYPPLELRDSEYSALFTVRLADCVSELRRVYGLPLTMMLYWGFCGEDYNGVIFNGNRSLTTKNHVCKPVETAHEFLSLMGDMRIETVGLKPGADEGIIGAAGNGGVQALIYYFSEYDAERRLPEREYELRFTGLNNGEYTLKVFTLDDTHNNTYRLWKRLGSPENPTAGELEKLYAEQEITPNEVKTISVNNREYVCRVALTSVSMKLVSIVTAQ